MKTWKRCVAPGCNNSHEGKSLFRFPLEPGRCHKWLRFCGLEDEVQLSQDVKRTMLVCQNHFLESEYYRGVITRLKSSAVPSIHSNGTVVPTQTVSRIYSTENLSLATTSRGPSSQYRPIAAVHKVLQTYVKKVKKVTPEAVSDRDMSMDFHHAAGDFINGVELLPPRYTVSPSLTINASTMSTSSTASCEDKRSLVFNSPPSTSAHMRKCSMESRSTVEQQISRVEASDTTSCNIGEVLKLKEEPEFELSNGIEQSLENDIETDVSLFKSQLYESDEEEEIKPPLAVFIVDNDGDIDDDDDEETVESLKTSVGISLHGTEEDTEREEGKDCEDADPDIKEELIVPDYGVNTISAHSYGNKTSIIEKVKYSRQMKNYKNERILQCDIFERDFKQKESLMAHNRLIHTVASSFQCDICKRYFICQKSLDSHNYIHTGEWRYRCNICKKGFNSKGHLLFHKKVHIGRMPFQCHWCEKGFIRKRDLLSHKNLHSDERPYNVTCVK